jgi:hypothetical protein
MLPQGGQFRSFAPFLIATPLLGVIAPLAYLTLRAFQPKRLVAMPRNPNSI